MPRWVSKALQIRQQGGVIHSVGLERQQPRAAPELDLTVREVCPSCNNGWLAELERVARLTLADPIRGFLTGRIPVTAHRPIAIWAVKTWLLAQHASASPPFNRPFPVQRDVFGLIYRERQPPPTATVWIGALDAADTGMVMRVGTVRVITPDGRIVGLNGVLCLGSLFLSVYMPAWLTTDPPAEQILAMTGRGEAEPYLRQLWPSTGHAIDWPPGRTLSVDDVERLWPSNLIIELQVPELAGR